MTDDNKNGYGKPPKDSQFKKGQSGNPTGRPKGRGNGLEAMLSRELNRVHVITVNGRRVKMNTSALLVKRLVEKAANGDKAALAICLKIQEKMPDGSKTMINALQAQIKELEAQLVASRKKEGGVLVVPRRCVSSWEEDMMVDGEQAIRLARADFKLVEEHCRAYFKAYGQTLPRD